jgi:hypothetical protein
VTEGPRHLNDETAMFPAIRREPKHGAPDTGEVPAMKRHEPGDDIHAPFGQWSLSRPEPVTPPPARPTRSETRKARRKPRWWRILLGE